MILSTAATAIAAVIYVPKAEATVYLAACLAYCATQGYFVAGTVTESMDHARRDARRLGATVIVVARREHAGSPLRVEVAGEAPRGRATEALQANSPRYRRPRRV